MHFPKYILAAALISISTLLLTVFLFFLPNDVKPATTSTPVHPISYVKDEYLRCVGLTTSTGGNNEATAKCLDNLAQYAYLSYETPDITAVLNTLPLEKKDRWCHETMHYMGWKAYQEEGDIASAFLDASELCDSGMYHGIMEEYLRQNGLAGNIPDLIMGLCEDSLSNHAEFSEGTLRLCYHGLGHGLMYITSSDLPASLDYCELLGGENASACSGGVLMEFSFSKELGPLQNAKDLLDFTYCEELTEHQKSLCYHRQGGNNLEAVEGNVEEAMRLCLQVSPSYHMDCFMGVGVNNPGPSKTYTQAGVDCKGAISVSTEAYSMCIQGSLSFISELGHGNPQGALDFCETVFSDQKEFCYYHMGSTLEAWTSSDDSLLALCEGIPSDEWRSKCVQGAQSRRI